jgi:hypothetical protein
MQIMFTSLPGLPSLGFLYSEIGTLKLVVPIGSYVGKNEKIP